MKTTLRSQLVGNGRAFRRVRDLSLALLLAARAASALGQGWVNFFNNSTTLISGVTGLPTEPAGSYYFGLFMAPVGTTDHMQFTFTGCYATNQAVPGRINGGWEVRVPGWRAGSARAFLVRGWPASLGHDWNPGWLPQLAPVATSAIATGIAGGFDGTGPLPPLNVFGSTTIASGFMIWTCLGRYWQGFSSQPASQTVILGQSVEFYVSAAACPAAVYQWYRNGQAMPGATEGLLRIANAQLADAGDYCAVLSNPWWPASSGTSHLSSTATLTVLAAPVITAQPKTQTVDVGATVELRVEALGSPPMDFRWWFNSIAVEGATAPLLRLTNVQPAQSGLYAVIISNRFGAVTSSPARLNIYPGAPAPLPRLTLIGQTGAQLTVEYATDLGLWTDWRLLGTVTLTNSPQWYFDTTTPRPVRRFYRAGQTDAGSLPQLRLDLVNEMPLE